MKSLGLARSGEQLSILCLGAHSDDIEIGAGGTILSLIAAGVRLNVHWCVLSATGPRATEATASARAFLRQAQDARIELAEFEDSYFPEQRRAIKQWLIELRGRTGPDIVFTHTRNDAHQDHREVCQLTWNIFRDHMLLEYEIPKWDGDLGQPNVFVPLTRLVMERKAALLDEHFGTQRSKDWFDAETFQGLARLRGMECRAPEQYAEAFVLRKARLL
ncbi:PIG-L deacetylase family protein [Aminobacter sp. HY435]|uniref:PIG-L deacetylase family protein n=1 Tax=Aminobacter sp. HY435 TaxID=2970917 RepID=UPI0022B96D98|nr:PIG-L deacetylase family protein [Aminobacter sp. HY435]